jgi:hypothetical protein
MSDHVELHDSWVELSVHGTAMIVKFCPAYVHHWERSSTGWMGEGRGQAAELVIEKGSFASPPPNGSVEVSGGWFKVGTQLYKNLIPVPIHEGAPVRGRLELVNAEPVELSGINITFRLVGESRYIEPLPSEWAPSGEEQGI